jgi:hypothetical protein
MKKSAPKKGDVSLIAHMYATGLVNDFRRNEWVTKRENMLEEIDDLAYNLGNLMWLLKLSRDYRDIAENIDLDLLRSKMDEVRSYL